MTRAALVTPTRTPTLEQQRTAFWNTKTGNREAEDALLWAGWLDWQQQPSHLGQPVWEYLKFMAEGHEGKPERLFAHVYRERARQAGYCVNRGKKPGLAFYIFQDKFKEKPGGWQKDVQPTQPGAEVLAFCKYRAVAFIKGREARERRMQGRAA